MTQDSSESASQGPGSRYTSPSFRRLKLLPSRFVHFSQLDKELCTYKIFFFLLFSSFGTILPFLPRYYQQIGFQDGERLSLLALRSVVQGLSAPLWGLIADMTCLSKRRLVQSCLLAWLIMIISMAFIEPTEQSCEFRMSNGTHSLFINKTKIKAGFFKRSLDTDPGLTANSHSLHRWSTDSVRKREDSEEDAGREEPGSKSSALLMADQVNHLSQVLEDWNHDEKNKLTQLKTPQIHSLLRKQNIKQDTDTSLLTKKTRPEQKNAPVTKDNDIDVDSSLSSPVTARDPSVRARDSRVPARERRGVASTNRTRQSRPRKRGKKRVKIQRHVTNEVKFNITSKNTLREDRKKLSEILNKAVWLVIISECLITAVLVHADSSLVQCLGQARTVFGHTRSFSSLGFMIFFTSVSALLSHSVRMLCSQQYVDFVICFCIFFVCTTATLTATTQLILPVQSPLRNIATQIKTQLNNSHFLTLLGSVTFLGFVHSMMGQVSLRGCVDCQSSFEDDSNLQIGRGISEIVGFCLSGFLLNFLGPLNVIFMCIVICNMNIFLGSFLRGSTQVVLVTVLDSTLFGVIWSALCIYFAHLSPPDAQGSLQGLLHSCYWGLGSGLGILISGPLYAVLGLANMLRISAIIGALVCMVFTLGLRSLPWEDRGYYTYLFSCWHDEGKITESQTEGRPLLSGKKADDGEDSGNDSGIESLEHDLEKITNEVSDQERKTNKKLTYARYSPPLKNSRMTNTTKYPEHMHENERGTPTTSPPPTLAVNTTDSKRPKILTQKPFTKKLKKHDKMSPSIPVFNQMILHRPKMTDPTLEQDGFDHYQ